jgi:uridylate kinase
MGQNLPIIVFNLRENDSIRRIMFDENMGTLIAGEA